ncbi:hypothetical protein NL676_025086 [Syzygium grande]|nr:hypothetical protein NL676_025086 [Syzygium grande]
MAKIASALLLSLLLVLAIQSAVWADQYAPGGDQMGQAADSAKGTAERMADSAVDAAEAAGDSASSWSHWFTGKLENFGLYHPDNDENGPAAAP